MKSYFELRNVAPDYYTEYVIPHWLRAQLAGIGPGSRILDFGCGFGQLVGALKREGYTRVEGADLETAAISHGRKLGHEIHDLTDDQGFYERNRAQYDVIVTLHVLEHIPKDSVISTVTRLRSLLTPDGCLIMAVPNAQAFTGCYWAYEDFTHETLYTSGSAYYVLKAAGFEEVRFLDIDCTSGLASLKKAARRASWRLFNAYYNFMCRLLANATHAPSPNIFSYELKVVGRNARRSARSG